MHDYLNTTVSDLFMGPNTLDNDTIDLMPDPDAVCPDCCFYIKAEDLCLRNKCPAHLVYEWKKAQKRTD